MRQVEHDLDLRLVVERQELHPHVLGVEERARGDRGQADADQKDFRAQAAFQQRLGDADVEAAHRADPVAPMLAERGGLASGEAQQEPGRHRHRDEEREYHRDRGVGRDRAHVGAHHAADEHHRQERRDDGQRRNDGRVADLGDRLNRGLGRIALAEHAPVARDVLDHDDRVVHENADREDEREQAHPVDGVAHHPGREEGEQDRRRDDDQHDQALAPADRERDQGDDRDGRQSEVKEKLVRLLGRGLAVVARDGDLEARRDHPAAQDVEPLQHVVGDGDRVRPLALGDSQRDRGAALQSAVRPARDGPCATLRLGGAHHDVRHVLHIDGPSVARREQQEADVRDALQGLAGEHRQRLAAVAERPDLERAVGVGDLVDELVQGDAEHRQFLRVGLDADLVRAPADDIGRADVVDLGQLVLQFLGDLEEAVVGPPVRLARRGREREGYDGDVVDAASHDQRLGDAFRQVAEIRADLLVDAERRDVLVVADEKARCHHDEIVVRLRIDVLDPIDALDQIFERTGDELDRLVGLVAVGLDDDVDHRHADLRLLLARQRDEGDRAGDERRQQEERRQRRIDERAGQRTRDTELHGATTSSPSFRPARISTDFSSPEPSWTTTSTPSFSLTKSTPARR